MKLRVVFSLLVKKMIVNALHICVLSMLTFAFVAQSFIAGGSFVAKSETIVECSVGVNQMASKSIPKLKDIIRDFFGDKKKKQSETNSKVLVYPGGFPLGFTMECDGVVVVALGSVETQWGNQKPTEGKNIKVGDILYSVNGEVIKSSDMLHSLLNPQEDFGGEALLEIHRDGQVIKERVVPALEEFSNMFRLGLWIRDNAAGVGTLTYIREDSLRFGALGHAVCDIDTGKIMPVASGSIYKCNIVGVNKGLRGSPGELRGLFLRTGKKAGSLDNNNKFGVYGTVDKEYVESLGVKPIEVGFRNQAKTGNAKILCTIDGGVPKEYDIEIVKLSYQSKSDKKSMVIKVVDKDLIEQTGGIVQGMSGSPIIQNNKLIGAVTHVFVSDPTKGFGVYIDWMLDN